MANRLTKLRLRAIGLVDKGANQDADIVLAKRDDSEDHMEKANYASMEECMAAVKDETKCKDLMAAVKRAEPKEAEMPEVSKADFEALQKRLEDSETARKASDERLAKMEDEAIAKAYVEKAEGFKGLPAFDPVKFAPILRKAYTALTKEEQDALDQIFRGASDSIAASKLLEEVGSEARGAGGSAYAKLEAAAKALIQKDGSLKFEQAFAKVCDDPANKALYAEYDKDRQAAERGR